MRAVSYHFSLWSRVAPHAALRRKELASRPGVRAVRRNAAVAAVAAPAIADARDRHVRRDPAHQRAERDPARYPRAQGVHRLAAAERAAHSVVPTEGPRRGAREVRVAANHRLLRTRHAQRCRHVAADEAWFHVCAKPAGRATGMEGRRAADAEDLIEHLSPTAGPDARSRFAARHDVYRVVLRLLRSRRTAAGGTRCGRPREDPRRRGTRRADGDD